MLHSVGDLPNISVQQLDYLVAVHEAPTWGDAAAAVGVTPSALSQGLAELERRLGVTLFERDGRRRVPTEAAAIVLDHAHSVLARTHDLARWAERRRAGTAGTVRIGMIDAAATIHGVAGLSAFRAARPEVDLRLQVAPSAELLRALVAGRLDVVVCVAPAALPEGVTAAPFVTEDLAVYAPPGTRSRPRSRPQAWGPWVTYPVGSQTRTLVLDALRRAGHSPHIVAESHQPDVLAQMVTLGLGWSVLPIPQADRSPTPLHRISQTPLTHRTLILAHRTTTPTAPTTQSLLHHLRPTYER